MKEQILRLDPHDDFISARDKMGWTQTNRVLVVWPPHSPTLTRRLDLVLLHRHAHMLGAHMAVIADDENVRENALELGLPVFGSIEESRRLFWRSRVPAQAPERRQPRPNPDDFKPLPPLLSWPRLNYEQSLTLRSIGLGLGLLAPLVMAFLILPAATIHLAPAARPLDATIEVVAEPGLTQPLGALVPARAVRVELEASGLVPTTSSKDVPSQPARGTVIFTNLSSQAAVIPLGTSVRTTSGTSIRFVTADSINLEGRRGVSASVNITAAAPGLAGNVPAGRINAVDGPLGLQVAVTNPHPTEGGTVSQRAAVADADRETVKAQLLAQLQQNGQAALEAQLLPGEFLVDGSVKVGSILTESYDHAVGEAADTIGLTLRIALTGLAVSEADVRQVALETLAAQVQSGESLAAGQIHIDRLPNTEVDAQGRAHLTLSVTGAATAQIDSDAARRLAAGRTLLDARDKLQAALPLDVPPRIEIWPGWFGRLPLLLYRIDVSIP